MEIIRLDGRKMTDRKATHAYLKRKLHLPEYYGNNLDALWDCLTTDFSGKMIILQHPQLVPKQLGDYGEALVRLMKEVAAANSAIRLILAYPIQS
ncbi:barstar family protein [Trichococcus ilyis]|jgi:ribonuclease inhibitor|uniref:Barstar (Barnase inhibitor) n=1 Tax=Trichococcus ilyis TaxID=640938 RepID=A0A143Z0V9_9LACT|nr:barstar family protein [Trichococcus ilyis]CZR02534.1 barstar (barnase inhibitor) [Trichococcus ilyis]SEJ66119.1 ribonuclease inhibitor [Trichococcus ilyis]